MKVLTKDEITHAICRVTQLKLRELNVLTLSVGPSETTVILQKIKVYNQELKELEEEFLNLVLERKENESLSKI